MMQNIPFQNKLLYYWIILIALICIAHYVAAGNGGNILNYILAASL